MPLTPNQFDLLHAYLGSPLRRLRRLRDRLQQRGLNRDHWEYYEQVVKVHDELYKLVIKTHAESVKAAKAEWVNETTDGQPQPPHDSGSSPFSHRSSPK